MEEDFIQRIRETEERAEAQCGAARDKGREMERAAAQKAKAVMDAREQDALRERERILREASESAQRQIKNQNAELNVTLNAFRQETAARTEEAVSYIVAKVVDGSWQS